MDFLAIILLNLLVCLGEYGGGAWLDLEDENLLILAGNDGQKVEIDFDRRTVVVRLGIL